MVINLFSEYKDQESQDQRDCQEHRIKCGDHAEMEIVSGLLDAVNLIDTVCNGKYRAACCPEDEQNRDGHDCDCGPCIDLLHHLHDHVSGHAWRQRL